METADEVAGERRKSKQAVISQNTFIRVLKKAEGRGMKVNTQKTNLLCISDTQSFRADGYIIGEDGVEILSLIHI